MDAPNSRTTWYFHADVSNVTCLQISMESPVREYTHNTYMLTRVPGWRGGVYPSFVPRPTCMFHFSASVGLVRFLTCVTRRVEAKGKFLHGRGQLQFSDNEGRQ